MKQSFLPVNGEMGIFHGRRKDFFQGIFPKFFQEGAKSGEICFFPLETKKATSFAEIFKIQVSRGSPPPTPMVFQLRVFIVLPFLDEHSPSSSCHATCITLSVENCLVYPVAGCWKGIF